MIVYAQTHTLPEISCVEAIIATSSWFYDEGKTDWPNAERARLFANQLLDGGPFILDIEHTRDVEHLKACFAMYRSRYPWLRMGLYGTMPDRVYLPSGSEKERWSKANQQQRVGRASLASVADFVVPSLYTLYLGHSFIERWKEFARQMLNEAGKYQKPIIVAISHQFQGHGDYIGDEYWEAQLRLIKNHPSQPEGVFCWSMPGVEMPESAQRILTEVL